MDKQKPTIAAVIVTWNSSDDIAACLDKLSAQTCPVDKIIVVDNGSNDDTIKLVRNNFPDIKLFLRQDNEGFARGNNIGISEAKTDWILTLNPDTELHEDYLEKLLEFAADRPGVGSLTGKLIRNQRDAEGNVILDSTGIEIYMSRRVKDRSAGTVDDGSWDDNERVFGACAAAAVYRREMLDEISPDGQVFAESFFSYYEDADLAWRAWRMGWECWYIPAAVCVHKRGGSPVGSRFSRYMTHRNRLLMIARNEKLFSSIKHFRYILAHEALMFLRIIRYPYLFKASLEALTGVPAAIRFRKRLQDKTSEPPPFREGIGFSGIDFFRAVRMRRHGDLRHWVS